MIEEPDRRLPRAKHGWEKRRTANDPALTGLTLTGLTLTGPALPRQFDVSHRKLTRTLVV
ncbi:MAG TPA: hypothetical protein VFC19_03800 [Candidatus Limnocylindrales bacterium]|nr:hypothetical protein [Candidatus Limnocylindrales bacterium]